MNRNLYRVLAAVSAMLLVACGAAEESSDTDVGAVEEPAAESEQPDEPGDAEGGEDAGDADGSEGADAEDGEADADPVGFVRIDGEEYPLEVAYNCEPRESSTLMDPRRPGSEVDGMIEFHTVAGASDEFAIEVWEQTTDGVRAQRLYSWELLGPERSIAAEGDEEYPVFEVDGNRVTVEAQHQVDADEWAEVHAEWTFPDDHANC